MHRLGRDAERPVVPWLVSPLNPFHRTPVFGLSVRRRNGGAGGVMDGTQRADHAAEARVVRAETVKLSEV